MIIMDRFDSIQLFMSGMDCLIELLFAATSRRHSSELKSCMAKVPKSMARVKSDFDLANLDNKGYECGAPGDADPANLKEDRTNGKRQGSQAVTFDVPEDYSLGGDGGLGQCFSISSAYNNALAYGEFWSTISPLSFLSSCSDE